MGVNNQLDIITALMQVDRLHPEAGKVIRNYIEILKSGPYYRDLEQTEIITETYYLWEQNGIYYAANLDDGDMKEDNHDQLVKASCSRLQEAERRNLE